MSAELYVGIGPPNVTMVAVSRGDTLVNVGGIPTLVSLLDVTQATWEVRGPTSTATLPLSIITQSAGALSLMRAHAKQDFPAEGHYDTRVRLTLPDGLVYTDWVVVRVRK